MSRRAGDRYLTPDSAFRCLLDRADEIKGSLLLDPASGDGRGAERVGRRFQRVVTNDLDPASPAEHHYDATGGDGMALWLLEPSWEGVNRSKLPGRASVPLTNLEAMGLVSRMPCGGGWWVATDLGRSTVAMMPKPWQRGGS